MTRSELLSISFYWMGCITFWTETMTFKIQFKIVFLTVIVFDGLRLISWVYSPCICFTSVMLTELALASHFISMEVENLGGGVLEGSIYSHSQSCRECPLVFWDWCSLVVSQKSCKVFLFCLTFDLTICTLKHFESNFRSHYFRSECMN